MAGFSGRWLVTASLVGVLGSPLAVLAQSGRPWVDPPPESDSKAQAPVSAPSTPPAQAVVPNPAPSSTSSPVEAKAGTETQQVGETVPQKTAIDNQTKQKPVVERKKRTSSQQASSSGRSQRREGQVVRRRATGTLVSQAEPRNVIERRTRVTRYGSLQEGLDAGLQVMRLRTIQLPDGRRIDVLTRPDQDITSGLPDGY